MLTIVNKQPLTDTKKGSEKMKEIQQLLEEIVKEQLNQAKENKTVPSKEVLDTISMLNIIVCSCH